MPLGWLFLTSRLKFKFATSKNPTPIIVIQQIEKILSEKGGMVEKVVKT